MANEENAESHGDSDPSADKHVIDSIPNTDATPTQTNNVNDNNIVNHGVDEKANGDVDESRNEKELQTLKSVYSVFSPKMRVYIVLMTVFGTLFSPVSAFIYIIALTPIAESYITIL